MSRLKLNITALRCIRPTLAPPKLTIGEVLMDKIFQKEKCRIRNYDIYVPIVDFLNSPEVKDNTCFVSHYGQIDFTDCTVYDADIEPYDVYIRISFDAYKANDQYYEYAGGKI